jgi:hypothetical protein
MYFQTFYFIFFIKPPESRWVISFLNIDRPPSFQPPAALQKLAVFG